MSEIRIFHTHIEVYPYEAGEKPGLEKMLSRYDTVRRKYIPVGFFIQNDILYLPRGISTVILQKYFNGIPTPVYKYDEFHRIKKGVGNLPPKSQIQEDAIKFFMNVMNADCDKISVENPVNIISGNYIEKHFPELQKKYQFPIKPTQSIQPFQFGDRARKKTCLWLKGLPLLKPTKIVDCGEIVGNGFSVGASADCARDENGKIIAWNDPRTAKERSKTFPGIAKAMAEQWGKELSE